MKISKKLQIIILILLILIGFILRVININQFPPSLNWDEVSHGYNAYSILKTGKDEWGNILPAIFRAFGDYKLPVYIYLTVPSVLLFGLNNLSVRLVSIIAGSLVPLFIFLILKKLFNNKSFIPLLGAAIFAFSPGTIFLSRIALEANLFLLFFCISIYYLIDKKLVVSSLFYGIGLFTYNSSRVLLPFYLILLVFVFFKNKLKVSSHWFKFIPFIILALLTVIQTLNQSGQARYQWVSLLDDGSINRINELRQYYPRILINKGTYFIFSATKNYFSHFNPQYLFFNGGSNYQFSLPNFFIISPLFLPFLFLGFYYILKNIKQENSKILLYWLLISPLPSSITRDAPHVLRSIIFIPIIVILITLGISLIANNFKKITIAFVVIVLIYGQYLFWPKYKSYAIEYSSSWQYGYEQMVTYVKNNYNNYDQFIITKKYGEPHEFILFYWPWNPTNYQTNPSKDWNFHANWYWIDGFDKFKFVNDWEVKQITQNIDLTKKTLLITSPNNYNQDNRLMNTINFLDQTPAFHILEINP